MTERRSSGMAKVIELSVVKQERRLSVEEAWNRFAEAKKKAEETLKLEDGLASNRALKEFYAACERAGL